MPDYLLAETKKAVERLFGDQSVSVREAIERLEIIASDIDIYLDGLREDLAREEREIN